MNRLICYGYLLSQLMIVLSFGTPLLMVDYWLHIYYGSDTIFIQKTFNLFFGEDTDGKIRDHC
tara:strand:- start:275 stop:463 length:189 start_codon:yes stop_codon:yes gene_type:complete